jgi:hypothetical protein
LNKHTKRPAKPVDLHDIEIGRDLLGDYYGYVWGVRVEGAFDSLDAVWPAVLVAAAQPRLKQRPPRAPPRLTDRAAGHLVFNERGEAVGCVVGAVDLAGGRFAGWARGGKVGKFSEEVEAEKAVPAGAAADAKAKAKAKKEK